MKEQEFLAKATELAKHIIDTIADREYVKLASFAQIDSSWIKSGQTQEAACLAFGEWLDGQLALWKEDEGREFVIDHFSADALEDIELRGNRSFVTYDPTNSGERLDLWFEIEFVIKQDGQIQATFNVNI